MKRFVLTGAPGAGKTAILRQLEIDGFSVVEEAATDVIALAQAHGVSSPWEYPSFIDTIVELQMQRLARESSRTDEVQFHDRSVVCTAALAVYLSFPESPLLLRELQRVAAERVFERRVFFVRNLGFTTSSEARRISFEDAQRFEKIHEETYLAFGFELVRIEAGSLADRVAAIKAELFKFGFYDSR